MDYGKTRFVADEIGRNLAKDKRSKGIKIDYPDTQRDYEFVRRGEPLRPIKFDLVEADRERLIGHFLSHGYDKGIPRLKNSLFEQHVCLFRASLDLYNSLECKKVFSRDEIYYRCLTEGLEFTEFIKDSRGTSLRGKTSLTDLELEEETFHPEYSGYDSIIHERYLIHWDDTDEVDDVKYAFIEANAIDEDELRDVIAGFLKSLKLKPYDFKDEISLLEELGPSKMYDPVSGKTQLMREFWDSDVDMSGPWIAKRAVVPVKPGGTRDTGIGTPETILKVKAINSIARSISEKSPYSANCDDEMAANRIARVAKRHVFLHLDFKKYGLTFPRAAMNICLEEISKISKQDYKDLYIDDFTLIIGDKPYKTCRGTCLGWLDALNAIVVQAILWDLSTRKKLNFDFIVFNDDVEISFYESRDPSGKADLVRIAVLTRFNFFDILISVKKTYASLGCVFLENYFHFEKECDLNMEKNQLAIGLYARSLVSLEPWLAKVLYSQGRMIYTNEYIMERCLSTCPYEGGRNELTQPLFCGGWTIPMTTAGLDDSLNQCDDYGICVASELQKYTPPKYSPKPVNTAPAEKRDAAINKKAQNSYPAQAYRELVNLNETFEDVNLEAEGAGRWAFLAASRYAGKDNDYPLRVLRVVEQCSPSDRPP